MSDFIRSDERVCRSARLRGAAIGSRACVADASQGAPEPAATDRSMTAPGSTSVVSRGRERIDRTPDFAIVAAEVRRAELLRFAFELFWGACSQQQRRA